MHKRGGDTTTTRSWNEKITHSPRSQQASKKKFQRQKERQKINWLLASSVLRGEWLRLYLCLTDFISFENDFLLYFKNYLFLIWHVFHYIFHLDRNRGYVLRSSRKKIKLVTRRCCNATEFSLFVCLLLSLVFFQCHCVKRVYYNIRFECFSSLGSSIILSAFVFVGDY